MSLFGEDNSFSSNLRTYRIRAGYTQTELAKRLGMTRQNYIRYEASNINAQPSIELLCKLAEILHTDVNTLVGYKATIDLETAYKKFDLKVYKNNIHFYLTISVQQRDESGFDIIPCQKSVTVKMPKESFDKLILKNYRYAYENTLKQVEEDREDCFIEYMNDAMYSYFVSELLADPKKK